jgi:hypothetical protein
MEKNQGLPPVTRRMTDESGAKKFLFTFYCDFCGAGFQTSAIPFSVANAPERREKFTTAQKLVWDSEHEDACERGNREALIRFPPCEDCGQHICDICGGELAEDRVCPDCRKKRGEQNNTTGGK